MLPRKAFSRIAISLAVVAGGVSLGNPTFAAVISKPSVTTSVITIDTVTQVEPGVFQLVEPQTVDAFTLVGASWNGQVAEETAFKVRLHENGAWSQWYDLVFHADHEADLGSAEEAGVLGGTDPLLTGLSDGIEVRMYSSDGIIPSDFKISLIDSRVTLTDKMIANGVDVTPQMSAQGFFGGASTPTYNYPATITGSNGAVVARPAMVTRVEWGADESKWLGPTRHGSTIKAGFIHHTVNTNNYTAAEVPGMLREMFVYFTQTRGYADLPYNFLIDKFGTLYEGRRGCDPGTDAVCDGPSIPNQGAHTAGFNPNTFAVSAIGSYHLASAAPASVLVDPIAQLFAWKFAPYGTDPLGSTSYTTAGTGTTARWPANTPVTIPTISGHRDVGITACPGNYLYDYIPAIRTKASELLSVAIRNVAVAPTVLSYADGTPITVTANIPANSTWFVDVKDPSGNVIQTSGVQNTTGEVSYTWNKPAGLAPGRYSVNINATYTPPATPTPTSSPTVSPDPVSTLDPGDGIAPASFSGQATVNAAVAFSSTATSPIALPERSTQVILASAPSGVQSMQFIRVSTKATKVKWSPATGDLVNASEYSYRYSSNGGRSWSGWVPTGSTEATIGGWARNKTFQVQVVARNFVGESGVITRAFKAGAVAAKPKTPSVSFTRVSGTSTRVNWAPSRSDKLPIQTSYYRYSLNGKSWSAWTPTGERSFTLTGLKAKKSYKVQIKLSNDVGVGTVAAKSFTQKR